MDKSVIVNLKDIEQPFLNKNKEVNYLKNVNLTVYKSEILAILGRQGQGQSALIRCINLLDRPLSGTVSIDNQNLTIMMRKDLRKVRSKIGMVTPSTQLMQSKTVYENIALPLEIGQFSKGEMNHNVETMLSLVGLLEVQDKYPRQLTTLQKYKLQLARALANKPHTLILEDISAGLDLKASHTLVRLLKEIHQELDLTIILVTHDIELIKSLCQRVAVMHHGEVVEIASLFEFFTAPQSEIGKEFVRAWTRSEIPLALRRQLKPSFFADSHPVYRFIFEGYVSPETLLVSVIDNFQVKINILQAHQETIQGHHINVLIIEIFGQAPDIEEAVNYLKTHELQAEVLGYVSRTH